MDCEKQYFYLTCHFSPDYSKDFMHMHDDIYRNIATGELFRKRLLCNRGWGQESGYVVWPELSFDKLIMLVTYFPTSLRYNPLFPLSKKQGERYYILKNNAEGAVSVIMQDHVDELVDFLSKNINTGYFNKRYIRKRFQLFAFERYGAREFGAVIGGSVGNKPYDVVFQEHPRWAEISDQVIREVYRW